LTRPLYWVILLTGSYRKYVAVQIKYAPTTFTDPWGTRVGIVGMRVRLYNRVGLEGRGPVLVLNCIFYPIQTSRMNGQEVSIAMAAATHQRTLFLRSLDHIRILSVRWHERTVPKRFMLVTKVGKMMELCRL